MNILYLHSHDTGRCTQPYGFPVPTPSIQRFAESGLLFRKAFSAAPTCSPSRAALLTGQSPHSAGMLGLAHRGFRLSDPQQHLANVLQVNGYRTALAGHQHLTTGNPHELGYQHVYERAEVPGHQVAANAVDFFNLARADPDIQPFFLDVGFSETHRPFQNAEPAAARYLSVLPGLPDIPAIRADVAGFHQSICILDRAVGTVLDALEASGLAQRTIVILTTDHGPAFPGMKSTLTDAGLGVELILRVPGITAPGSVTDALVSQIDLFPTLCDIVGIQRPGWLQGASLLPLIEGTRDQIRSETFGEVTFHAAYEPQRSIRTDRWLYLRRFADRANPVLPNVDDSLTFESLLEFDWDQLAIPSAQLFDNMLDPVQSVNRVDDPGLQPIAADLDRRLTQWMRETADPLLAGPVPLPFGAVANRPFDRSPDGPLYGDDVL